MMSFEEIRAKYDLPSVEEMHGALDRGETLPVELYTSPEVYDLERERVFNRSWQYACHESVVAKPGDYAVTKAGDVPIIVVHGKDGQLRGFVNVCRHRLHSIAETSGSKPLLQCPYHGWTYGLDGKLRSAPRSEREPTFDCSSISLEPVSVERWDQWIFVNPDPHARSLAELTHAIRARTDEINADLRHYEFQVRYEYTMTCNWKLWAENAVECYHCPTLHRSSFGKTYEAGPDDYLIESDAQTIYHCGPIKWLPDGVDPAGLKGFRFAFAYPSSFFALDDYVGFVGQVVPLDVDRCFAFVDMYARPGADEVVVKQWLEMWDETLKEDKLATDIQQVGYQAGRIPAGRMLLDSEHALQSFMRATLDALTS